jgi:hypothetical protein
MSYKLTCIHHLPLFAVLVTNVMQDSVFPVANIRNVHLSRSVATKASTKSDYWIRVLVKKKACRNLIAVPTIEHDVPSVIFTNVYSKILFSTERLDWQKKVTSPSSLNNVMFKHDRGVSGDSCLHRLIFLCIKHALTAVVRISESPCIVLFKEYAVYKVRVLQQVWQDVWN